jgi:hypothetical protein
MPIALGQNAGARRGMLTFLKAVCVVAGTLFGILAHLEHITVRDFFPRRGTFMHLIYSLFVFHSFRNSLSRLPSHLPHLRHLGLQHRNLDKAADAIA